MSKNSLLNLIILIISGAFAFAVAEYAFRLLPLSERLGWQLLPPVSERYRDFKVSRHDGDLVIVGVGDSFTEFQDTLGRNYLRIAEKELARQGHHLSVLNLGEAGTNFSQYLNNFCAALPDLKPDLVIFGVYAGNDIRGYSKVSKPLHCRISTQSRQRSIKSFFKQSLLINSAYRLLKVKVPIFRSGFYSKLIEEVQDDRSLSDAQIAAGEARMELDLLELAKADAINAWDAVSAVIEPDYYVNLSEAPEGEFANDVENFAAAAADNHALCERYNTRCLFVIFPVAPWVHEKYQSYFERLGSNVSGLDKKYPPSLENLLDKLSKRNVPFLDLLPVLKNHSDQNLYIPMDGHINVDGHRIVGQALISELKRRNWLAKR